MTYTINHNSQYNSVEIAFDGKPSEKIREALKALRFRWHRALGVWYGYTDEQTARQAIDAAENGEAPAEAPAKAPEQVQNRRKAKKPVLASLWDRCDVSALPGYGTDNEIKKAVRAEANAAGGSYDKHVAAYIRKHLKERFPECKFSVTSGGAGWLNNVDVTVKAGPYGRRFVKGNGDWNSRDQYDHWENSDELAAVLRYCEKLFDSFDDDDGDIYADYGAHHDLYGGVSVSSDYTQTQATPEQIASAADFAERKAQAEAEQKAREAAEMAEREKQMELDRIEAARLEEIRKQQEAEIVEHVRIEDLPESEQITLVALDPWTMAAGAVTGTLNSASPKQYAQHADAVEITYTPAGKRKPERVYIYKGKEALLYRGALPDVPASIKYTDCGGNLQRVNFAGDGAKDFLREVIKYYSALGFAPVVDTIQR